MKTLLKELYNLEVNSFIKLSDKAYKIKTSENDYILKYIDNINLDMIIERLNILNIHSFLFPIINNKGEYISFDNDISFLLFPFLHEEKVSLNDLKVKFFLTELATLHNKTYYPLKVNETFFKDTYEFIGERIDECENKIKSYIEKIEKADYKSPSEWLFLLNYPLYIDSIDKSNTCLEKFKEISYKKNSVRMAFTYTTFDYKHIFLKEGKIIGIENIELASPVYDIFFTLSTTKNITIDIKNYYLKYFNTFILEDYEKEWLSALLYMPRLEINSDECLNMINISKSLEQIKSSYEIIETFKNSNKE
jgi:hypothetical protein